MAIANYTRLNSGSWGLRVKGVVHEGDRLSVGMKGGRCKNEVVERVIWRDGEISLCSIQQKVSASARKKRAKASST